MDTKIKDNKTTLQSAEERVRIRENKNKPVKEQHPKEIGGRIDGLEPTRYGDWEYKGRCIDF